MTWCICFLGFLDPVPGKSAVVSSVWLLWWTIVNHVAWLLHYRHNVGKTTVYLAWGMGVIIIIWKNIISHPTVIPHQSIVFGILIAWVCTFDMDLTSPFDYSIRGRLFTEEDGTAFRWDTHSSRGVRTSSRLQIKYIVSFTHTKNVYLPVLLLGRSYGLRKLKSLIFPV